MATINRINLTSSGIASYDGAGTFSALANPLTVANGGTGDATLTAYAVLCGGTTTTAAIQSIASVGTANQILTSNGAGTLPTFQTAPTVALGFAVFIQTGVSSGPVDGTTYYFASGSDWSATTTSTSRTRIYMTSTCTVNSCYGNFHVANPGSAENCTVAIRKNDTTNTNVKTTIQLTATDVAFNGTSLGVALVAGDFIDVIFISPTWATNPFNLGVSVTLIAT
jgi:hypothetical protein